jgi:hypothetical protein
VARARKQGTPDREDVLALVAPFMDGNIDAAAFFQVAGGGPRGRLLGVLLWAPMKLARERRSGLGAFTYLAINGREIGAFELRWAPFHVHRVIGHWPVEHLQARRTERHAVEVTIKDQRVELEAAAPGPDATAVIDRLTAAL